MTDDHRTGDSQLSFDIVIPDRYGAPPVPLFGTMKIKGAFSIDRNFNMGDELTVTILDVRTGELIATGLCRMEDHAKIKAVLSDGRHVADEREHTITLTT